MENEDSKMQRTSGNRIQSDEVMQNTGKRNPGILQALDAVHRSLLNNNLKYEGRMRRAICCVCFVFFYFIFRCCFHLKREYINLNAI